LLSGGFDTPAKEHPAYAEQLLPTDEGGADREEAYRGLTGNFELGQTIEIAERTKQLQSKCSISISRLLEP